MDFRSLQLFRHLASSLHFGETASALYVSPSTLSRIIQRMEDECGCSLFTRDNRSVTLTHAGERMARFADSVLGEWEGLQQDMQREQTQLQGEVSLYCSVTASQSHLPNIIRQLAVKHPMVTLKLQTGDPAFAIRHVVEKQVDVSIAIKSPQITNDLHFMPLDDVPLVMIAPRQWRISSLESVDWASHPVVMPETGPSKGVVYQWFKKQGIQPNIYANVGGNEAIVSMVALGCGLGFVPQIVLDHSTAASQVSRVPVRDIGAYTLGFCCLASRKNQPLVQALFNMATELSY
ncbi:HTH-type transcriptional activator IlvY [Alteromonas sediminis]|uniref:HTH-type transcriptional activator IlvY n=1 Tax=Alteromonas sediminis TaxID=2259342 RepID=A0A3N5Y766_9ALTE|nr:HTH-type transcriptional activator IlvY [Alteromonas sediminis]RPJ66529.1 HTH-type transcriptional activator IlvY [Alteromonas sediminis]